MLYFSTYIQHVSIKTSVYFGLLKHYSFKEGEQEPNKVFFFKKKKRLSPIFNY